MRRFYFLLLNRITTAVLYVAAFGIIRKDLQLPYPVDGDARHSLYEEWFWDMQHFDQDPHRQFFFALGRIFDAVLIEFQSKFKGKFFQRGRCCLDENLLNVEAFKESKEVNN